MTDAVYNDFNPQLYQDIHGIEQIKANPNQQQGLSSAADQFEVQFLQMVLKNIREATDSLKASDDIFSSSQQSFYQEMYDDQLAVSMVKNDHFGLSNAIVQQMGNKLKPES